MGEENLARAIVAEKYENLRVFRCTRNLCTKVFGKSDH